MAGIIEGNFPKPNTEQRSTPLPNVMTTRFDHYLFYTTIALLCFGLMAVFTASANQAQLESGNSLAYVIKQSLAIGIGIPLMLLMARIPFQFWRKMALPVAVIAIGLLLMTMFFGVTANGSERWISLPFGFQLQASDPAKIAAIFLAAQATSTKRWYDIKALLNCGLILVMIGLIYQQPNLSVSMILGIVTFAMMFVNGFSMTAIFVIAPPFLYFLYHKIHATEYQWRRITGWLNPWKDPLDSGYNLIQSYYAIGSGGLLGVGLGNSIQKLYYLPFQHTDFIFSVICEELGFPGALIVIGLFVLLACRGFSIAMNCPHKFGQMLAFGLTLAILLQAMINMSVTIGLMPVTGVTLPLISYGGTSIVTTLGMIGILLNISRYRPLSQLNQTPG